jgi:hypothetical protein
MAMVAAANTIAAGQARGLLICAPVMDDVKTLAFSILLTLTILAPSVFAEPPAKSTAEPATVEYIAPTKQSQLEDLFNHAEFSSPKHARSLKHGPWVCDMYGVRSRMQVRRDLRLYVWSGEAGAAWHNDGAQLVSEYRAVDGSLTGTHDRFEDQVKLTADGRLISRLSVLAPQRAVVAYSVCRNL